MGNAPIDCAQLHTALITPKNVISRRLCLFCWFSCMIGWSSRVFAVFGDFHWRTHWQVANSCLVLVTTGYEITQEWANIIARLRIYQSIAFSDNQRKILSLTCSMSVRFLLRKMTLDSSSSRTCFHVCLGHYSLAIIPSHGNRPEKLRISAPHSELSFWKFSVRAQNRTETWNEIMI